MNDWKKMKLYFLFCFFLCLSYHLYFIYLLPDVNPGYLYYLDFLLGICGLLFWGIGYWRYRKKQARKKELLKQRTVIYSEFPDMEGYEIAEHDVRVLNEQLEEQYRANCDLQDYIAKWCHEVKIPLAASLLMNQKIEDGQLRFQMQEQLERVSQQLNAALLGCKVQSSLFDIQIKSVPLPECVRTSIRNNQFFLIKSHFQMEIDVADVQVYTDKSWLVYVLDQLIGNAVKYVRETAVLKIWSRQADGMVQLFVEDHGEGIREADIRRIFEKGYVGSSHHNGKYKSTGMGLYMAAQMIERLGHQITVESQPLEYTRFMIEMTQNLTFL